MKAKFLILAGAAMTALPLGSAVLAEPAAQHVVTLTQVPCQFLESEGGRDRGFKSRASKDCEAINAKSGPGRLKAAKPMELKPGRTVFRVTNKNVPYELGFWLRGDGLAARATLPGVSGGGLTTGKSREYAIDLVPGEYVYSCPLNPTPDYKLVVRN